MGYGHTPRPRGVRRWVAQIANNQLRGIALAAGGATLISFDGLLIRLQSLSPAGVTFWRGVFTCVAFSFVLFGTRWRRRQPGERPAAFQRWPVAALALLMLLGTVTFVFSLTQTTVAHTVVIVASSPILTGVLGVVLLHERLPLRTWLAGLATLVGVAIIVAGSFGTADLRGDLWAVGNTVVLALILILLRRYPFLNRVLALAISSFATAAVVLPWSAALPDTRTAVAAAVDGLLVVPGGLLMITLAPRYLPAAEVGLLLLLETILGPLWVLVALGEALTVPAVISATIILGAIVVHSIFDLRKQPLTPAEAAET